MSTIQSFRILSLIFVFSTSMVYSTGFTMKLYHKTHPILSRHYPINQLLNKAPYKGEVTSFRGEYVIHFSIGTPPLKTFAVFDTATTITWLQTSTCDRCVPQPPETLSDLTRSSTFKRVACTDRECGVWMSLGAECDHRRIPNPECKFNSESRNGGNSSGYLAIDVFTFSDGSDPAKELNVSLLFGVGTHNFGVFRQGREQMAPPGVLGLSHASWYQLGYNFETTQFSFCIPDDTNSTGYLKFGTSVEVSGSSIKLIDDNDFYVIRLTGISFNGKPLKAENSTAWKDFSMIVDTGTPVSKMDGEILKALKPELEGLFDVYFGHEGYNMCWDDLSAEDEAVKNLTMTLHFDDLEFHLYQPQIWILQQYYGSGKIVDIYCINFVEENSSPVAKRSILGSMQMTNKNMAFAYATGDLAIQERNC